VAQLKSFPIELNEANEFVRLHHRHHIMVVGHKFSIGALIASKIVGVVIVGRPVARGRDDGFTLEVTRLCTDGTKNACSFLYALAARATFALGYRRIGTYILKQVDHGLPLLGFVLISTQLLINYCLKRFIKNIYLK